jgi:hypothetical protein
MRNIFSTTKTRRIRERKSLCVLGAFVVPVCPGYVYHGVMVRRI